MKRLPRLSYEVLEENHYDGFLQKEAPERILQVGEGGFLRGFVDCFVDCLNERTSFCGKVAVTRPRGTSGSPIGGMINEQEGLYTLILRGRKDGQPIQTRRVISAVSRCFNPMEQWEELQAFAASPDLRYVISNTTEAGIVYDGRCRLSDNPPASFPAKMTRLLLARYERMGRAQAPGLVFLACELIDDNGEALRDCIRKHIADWGLPEDFRRWVDEKCVFCSTLVDRIVTGYPRAEAELLCRGLGYEDTLIDTAEPFGFWAIQADPALLNDLPFAEAGLPVLITDDIHPYKKRKVRLLNGAHTSLVLGAWLAGKDIVRDCMSDSVLRRWLEREMVEEIIPTIDLPKEELDAFAASVLERFDNPYIDHSLLAIALNSTSKWRARVLPTLLDFAERNEGKLPRRLAASLAFYLAFYRVTRIEDGAYFGGRGDREYPLTDEPEVLRFFAQQKDRPAEAYAEAVLGNEDFWGMDLRQIPGLLTQAAADLKRIETEGAMALFEEDL